jgi:nicotinamide-nucleotide amidase
MKAYILSTGDEVLLGDIVDTNSSFLCSCLKDMGIEVQKIIAVSDNIDAIASTIKDSSSQTDICLVTGGLGPTKDDLTALACSKAADDTLMLNNDALKSMQIYFKKKGFQLTKDNEKQAMLPAKSKMIENRSGTAPGFYIKINRCLFFFMPGVPSEMKLMFNKKIKKILVNKFKLNDGILIERLTLFGLPESKAGFLLKEFENYYPQMRLGFRADFLVIEVKIVLSDFHIDKDKALVKIKDAKQWIIEKLGNKVVSTKGRSIAQEVGLLLTQQHKTLAIAESCTGGLIANMMTDISGSSDFFLFSGVTYSNDAKINILNVQKKTIIDHGAVHEQTALEMAKGAKQKSGADFAISTTGVAGPTGGTKQRPVGMVCIGIAGPDFAKAKTYKFSFDDRLLNKKMFATMALEFLRRHLVTCE